MARVEIIFSGKDDVTGTIKTVNGDIKDLDQATKSADKSSKGLFASLGGIGKLALGAGIGLAVGAVAGLGAALLGGMDDARQANLIFAQSQAVITSTGGAAGVSAQHVADYASSLSDAAGQSLFGDDQIAQSTNMLLTFTNIKGTVLDAATAISVDMAQALGGAPKDAAIQLGKALNDPVAGISALTRVGVTFSEEQKAVIQSMMDTGNVAGAQQVIIAELNKEFGGSAAAAAAAAGPMAQLKGQFGEMAESIGAQLLPLLDQFVGWLSSPAIQDAIVAIGTGLVDAVLAAVAGFQTFLAAIAPVVGFVQDNLTAVLAALVTMLLLVVVPAFVTWAAAASAAAIATITALAPVLIPIAAIGAAVGLLVTAWNRDWGGMRTTLTAWWTGTVEPILKVVWDWLSVKLTAAINTLKAAWLVAWPLIQAAVSTVYTFLVNNVFPAIMTGMQAVATAVGILRSAFVAAWGGIQSAAQTASGIITSVISHITSAVNTAIGLINQLIGLINKIPGVNIPGIGSIGGKSIGGFTSLAPAGGSGFSGTGAPVNLGGGGSLGGGATHTTYIDARGATDPRGVEAAIDRAFRSRGIRTDLRTRTA